VVRERRGRAGVDLIAPPDPGAVPALRARVRQAFPLAGE
jgi:hypothetical protein